MVHTRGVLVLHQINCEVNVIITYELILKLKLVNLTIHSQEFCVKSDLISNINLSISQSKCLSCYHLGRKNKVQSGSRLIGRWILQATSSSSLLDLTLEICSQQSS